MYTRCPSCLTIFKVTQTQLDARWGLVRCGHCDSLFYADQHFLYETSSEIQETTPPFPETKTRTQSLTESDTASGIPTDTERTAKKSNTPIPTVSELTPWPPKRRSTRKLWALGSVVLALLLIGQSLFFYHNELARYPELRPALIEYCRIAGCQLSEPSSISAAPPELVSSTIAPHPGYANGLRIRMSMVNRSDTYQPYPLVEISMTDNNGTLLTRRIFTPEQYLETSRRRTQMPPNVVLETVLDVLNPDNRAVGYEIQLLPNSAAIQQSRAAQ